jgi:lysophospholipase L1-like esterase
VARRHILPRLLLAIAVSALALAGAEWAVRAIRDPRPIERQEQRAIFPTYYPLAEAGLFTRDRDERLRYRLTPGFDMELDGRRYRVSSLGLRGGELGRQRPTGWHRVVVLGDSFAFGLGVDESETYPAQLESMLRAAGRSAQVANLGVPGYHSGQELAWLERAGFALDPDLVVLLYYGNDEIGEAFQYDPAFRVLYGDALPVPYWLKGVLAQSAIYRWLARADIGRLRRRGELSSLGSRHWPVTEDRLERMIRACAERGTPLLIANLPLLWSSEALADPAGPGYENADRVNRLAERNRVPLVDLRPVLLARRQGPGDDFLRRLLISPDPPQDHHLTAEGYTIIAAAAAEKILTEELLPAR